MEDERVGRILTRNRDERGNVGDQPGIRSTVVLGHAGDGTSSTLVTSPEAA
jgi:hypothetical protein